MADQITPSTDSSQLMSALSVDMSGPLNYQNLTKKHNDLNKQLTELEMSTADLQTTRDLEAAKARKKSIDDANTKYEASIAEQQKKLDSFGDVKFQPTQDNLTDIAGLFSAVGIIGSMIGGKGKNASLSALSAMDGMLSGWSQGRADLFKKEKATFDEKLNVIKAEKDAIIQQMKIIAEEYTHDKEKAEQNFQVLLAEKGGPVMRNIAMQKGFKGALDYVDNVLGKAVDNAVQHSNRMSEKQGTLGGAGLGYGNFLKNTIGTSAKDEKTNKSIVDNATGLASVEQTIKTFVDPDIRTGVQAYLTNIREQAKSVFGTNGEISPEEVNKLINGAVNPADKNAVAIKDALFTSFAVERAAQGGRVTVQMMNVGGSALNPKSYTKEAYLSVLGSRRNDLIRNLRGEGLNDQQIATITSSLAKPTPGLNFGGGQTSQTIKEFNTVEEAEKANLPSGTRIKINGRMATVE